MAFCLYIISTTIHRLSDKCTTTTGGDSSTLCESECFTEYYGTCVAGSSLALTLTHALTMLQTYY